MILGIALHFLPRLRGAKLVRREWVPVLFWLLVGGLSLRVIGQIWSARLNPLTQSMAVTRLTMAIASGVWLQALGVWGIVAMLGATFLSGPPLAKNHGFKQIAPLLLVAASALSFAQLAWGLGVLDSLFHHRNLAVLPVRYQWAAVDLMLFGFIAAVSIAMSSRIFPLTFRMQLPHRHWLKISAAFLFVGVILTLADSTGFAFTSHSGTFAGLAALSYAVGLLGGAEGVRIFHARKPLKGGQPAYRITEDPAAVGVVSAYVWAVVAALTFLLFALQQFRVPFPAPLADRNLARHAAGAGFMTLLILSVGWKMLPGFGGGRPRARGLVWAAVALGNSAAFLRILPALLACGISPGRNWGLLLFPSAGIAGLATLLAFAIALVISLRTAQ